MRKLIQPFRSTILNYFFCLIKGSLFLFFFSIIQVLPGQSLCDDNLIQLDSGLLAYYPLDENVEDFSNNSNDGQIQGAPSFTTGYFSDALDFDGSNDYVEVNHDLNFTDTFTVAVWVNWENAGHTWQNILAKYETNGFGPYAFSVKDNRFNFWISNGTSGNTNFDSGSTVPSQEWVHVLFEGEGGIGRIFVNGVLDAEHNIPAMTQNDDLVTIARQALPLGSNHGDFKGSIDDLRVYNRILTTDEKQALISCDPGIDPVMQDTVIFRLGTESGWEGSIVSVPVTVENFNNVSSFQYSIHLNDPNIATIASLSGFNLPDLNDASFLIDGNQITVAWADFSGNGISVADESPIFHIDLLLEGAVGDCSNIIINGTPTPVEVSVFQDILPVEAPYLIFDGEICVIQANYNIGGRTQKENGIHVGNVTVNCTGVTPIETGPDGLYQFNDLPRGQGYEIRPEKDINPIDGVSAMDIVFIIQHILGTNFFNSPYKIIAADVNGNNAVTTMDVIHIRRLILGITDSFPDMPSWRFVPASFEFPEPDNPFFSVFPESLQFDSLLADAVNQDFIAIKLGDVNLTAAGINEVEERAIGSLILNIEDIAFEAGEMLHVPVYANDFSDIQAYQLALHIAPSLLEVMAYDPGVLPGLTEDYFGAKDLASGTLSNLWYADNGTSYNLKPIEPLFVLTLKAKNSGKLSEALSIHNQQLLSAAYRSNQAYDFALNFTKDISKNQYSVQVFPNPIRDQFQLQVEWPDAALLEVQLIQANGCLVKFFGTFTLLENSPSSFNLDMANVPSGVYWLHLKTADQSQVHKVVKL